MSDKALIQCVDDEPVNLAIMEEILQDRFRLDTVSSGEECLQQVEIQQPDLILLDYMLPDVNGNIVCQTIRENPEFGNIKIIVVSGVVKQDEIDQLLKSGAEDFIKKPFNITELTDKIAAVLQMK